MLALRKNPPFLKRENKESTIKFNQRFRKKYMPSTDDQISMYIWIFWPPQHQMLPNVLVREIASYLVGSPAAISRGPYASVISFGEPRIKIVYKGWWGNEHTGEKICTEDVRMSNTTVRKAYILM